MNKLAAAADEATVAATAATAAVAVKPSAKLPAKIEVGGGGGVGSPYRKNNLTMPKIAQPPGQRPKRDKVPVSDAVRKVSVTRLVPSATANWRREDYGAPSPVASQAASTVGGAGGEAQVQLSAAISAESQAREHLRKVRAKVQRELARASSMAALEDIRARKAQLGQAVRTDFDKVIGRDLTRKIAEGLASGAVEPASPSEVQRLSELFNQRMIALFPDSRTFFTLFKHMDVDGSRRVSFREFSTLLRDELRISKTQMPLPKLHALWMVLDDNSSGYVDAGELGRFMKLGKPEQGAGNRVRVQLQKKVGRKGLLAEMEKRSGAELTQRLERDEVPPATNEELLQMSAKFNAAIEKAGINFYRLFKQMDGDDSGRISFKELARMVRVELQLPRAELPHVKLQGLWRALDENQSGFICAGEFGRFMMLKPPQVANHHVLAQEKKREAKNNELRRSDELWKLRAARRAETTAAALAAEAQKLEAALAAASAAGASVGSPTLPQLSPNGGRMTTSSSASVLETNAALQKLARETLALSQGRESARQ